MKTIKNVALFMLFSDGTKSTIICWSEEAKFFFLINMKCIEVYVISDVMELLFV